MRKIIVGGLSGTSDLAQTLIMSGSDHVLYLGATVDLCRQMRTELVRLNCGNTSFATFQDLARRYGSANRLLSSLEQEALFIKLAQGRWPQIQSMAEFPGFWRELARAASELAQAGARPENLLGITEELSGLPGEVCELLAAYWQYLEEHKLRDADLGLRAAARSLREKEWSCLVVDGFSDFTALQEEILLLLCERSQQIIFNLMGATPSEARALAGRLGGGFQLEELSQDSRFMLAPKVQVLATASLKQEVEEACRWLKEQIIEGCAPSELVLIARHPDLYRNQVAQTLEQMEIPSEVTFKVEDLELSPILAARTAISLLVEDWPQASFIKLVELLIGLDMATVLDRLSREANLIGGSSSWLELIENSLGAEGEEVLTLCQELSQLSQPQRLEEYCQRLWQLVKSRVKVTSSGAPALSMFLALGRLEAILAEVSSLATYYPEKLENAGFETLFLKAAGGTSSQLSPRSPYRGTGVRLLDPVGARGLVWRGAVVLGLEEGAYPTPWPEDWLFSEKIRQAFRQGGIRLRSRAAMAGRERDFFQLALSRAQERLLLSYKTADDGGGPKLPSPYLVELLKTRDFAHKELALSQQFPEDSSQVATDKELALFALSTGSSQLWDKYQARKPKLAKQISRATAVIKKRNSKLWSPFDGQLQDSQIHPALPFSSQYIWSAGQLETYSSCPFRFFCQEVLKIRPYPRLEAELTPKDLGTVLHNVLAQFFQNHKGKNLLVEKREEYRQELMILLEGNWQGMGEDIFAQIQKEDARAKLYRFLDQELKRQQAGGASLLPRFLEASFGMGQDPCPGPVEVELPSGKVRLRGRIDRLDVSPAGEFLVLDYKLSYIPDYKELRAGLSLQLPIYLWAGEKLLGAQAKPIAALFYSLGQGKYRGFWRDEESKKVGLRRSKNSSLEPENWDQTLENYRLILSLILKRIGSGDFRLLPQKCPPFCDYTTICRYQKWRIRRKEGAASVLDS